jgi:hypothetical protein
MPKINRAMFPRRAGLIPAGAAATFHRWIAMNVLQEWLSTIGDPAPNNSKRASFTNRSLSFPVRIDGFESDSPELGGYKFPSGLCQHRHDNDYRSLADNSIENPHD